MEQSEADMLCSKILSDNNGYFLIKDAEEMGIAREYAFRYLESSLLQKADKGIYLDPAVDPDRLYILSLRHKNAVFSHETALQLYDLTGSHHRISGPYVLSVPTGYHSEKLKDKNSKIVQSKKEYFEIGITSTKTEQGHVVKVYDMDRTICDMIRKRSRTDPDIYRTALKNYFASPYHDIPRLLKYARIFRIEKQIAVYAELLM